MSTTPSTVAQALISQGKAAVEAELSRIEGDLTIAKNKAITEAASLATELATYMNAHAAEVNNASALIARANVTTSGSTVPVSTVPAITLTKPVTVGNTIAAIKTWLSANGWKGYLVLGIGVLVLRYIWVHKII
jgi:hypothetical protein